MTSAIEAAIVIISLLLGAINATKTEESVAPPAVEQQATGIECNEKSVRCLA
jgi:hypothetical protein